MNETRRLADPAASPPTQPATEPSVRGAARLASEALLGGRTEVEIVHGGEVYRLRCTRTGKLILTK